MCLSTGGPRSRYRGVPGPGGGFPGPGPGGSQVQVWGEKGWGPRSRGVPVSDLGGVPDSDPRGIPGLRSRGGYPSLSKGKNFLTPDLA